MSENTVSRELEDLSLNVFSDDIETLQNHYIQSSYLQDEQNITEYFPTDTINQTNEEATAVRDTESMSNCRVIPTENPKHASLAMSSNTQDTKYKIMASTVHSNDLNSTEQSSNSAEPLAEGKAKPERSFVPKCVNRGRPLVYDYPYIFTVNNHVGIQGRRFVPQYDDQGRPLVYDYPYLLTTNNHVINSRLPTSRINANAGARNRVSNSFGPPLWNSKGPSLNQQDTTDQSSVSYIQPNEIASETTGSTDQHILNPMNAFERTNSNQRVIIDQATSQYVDLISSSPYEDIPHNSSSNDQYGTMTRYRPIQKCNLLKILCVISVFSILAIFAIITAVVILSRKLSTVEDNLSNLMKDKDILRGTTMVSPTYATNRSFKGHTGTMFWISFPSVYSNSNEYQPNKKTLLLTAKTSTNVSIETITGVNASSFLICTNKYTMDLSYSFVQDLNIIQQYGIMVKANNYISLYGYSELYPFHSTYSYISWIPPSDRLGTTYIAVSYQRNVRLFRNPVYYSYISTAATHADTSIKVTLNTTGIIKYNDTEYGDGDRISLYLNKFQTIQLSSNRDITGSKVQSNRPVAVQSGATSYLKIDGTNIVTSGSLYLPPLNTWGKIFVIPPIQTAVRYAIRVVPSEHDMSVTITGNNSVTYHPLSSTLEFEFPAAYMFVVICSKSCFVSQYPASKSEKDVAPYMTIVPAVEQFSYDYHVTPVLNAYKNHFISIMIRSDEANGILLNGTTVASLNVDTETVNISSNSWSVLSISVPEGSHKVSHTSPNSVFGLIAYGFGNRTSYGFVVGLNI